MIPTARVRVAETDIVLEAGLGEDLLEVLQRGGCSVDTACGGIASCGLCRIEVLSGEGALTPLRAHEATHVSTPSALCPGTRLACQARVRRAEDIVVRVVQSIDLAEPD